MLPGLCDAAISRDGLVVSFAKGHGTGNDFVIISDLEGALDLSADAVRDLCDRRTGLGADGLLRVVRAHGGSSAEFFMDYRNADGSIAEMCGNGARVFVRYLIEEGLLDAEAVASGAVISTRGGDRPVRLEPDDDISVAMGRVETPLLRAAPLVRSDGRTHRAVAAFVPNPHAVVFVDDPAEAGDLRTAPEPLPEAVFPDGANVEFVAVREPGRLTMRVHERGVGETASCGTGACAAVWAARRQGGDEANAPRTWTVEVPGGVLRVDEAQDGHLTLSGPAVIVARGQVALAVQARRAEDPA